MPQVHLLAGEKLNDPESGPVVIYCECFLKLNDLEKRGGRNVNVQQAFMHRFFCVVMAAEYMDGRRVALHRLPEYFGGLHRVAGVHERHAYCARRMMHEDDLRACGLSEYAAQQSACSRESVPLEVSKNRN